MSVQQVEPEEFIEGDVVTLVSGGAPMTVLAERQGQVDVIWSLRGGEIKHRTLPRAILIPFKLIESGDDVA